MATNVSKQIRSTLRQSLSRNTVIILKTDIITIDNKVHDKVQMLMQVSRWRTKLDFLFNVVF